VRVTGRRIAVIGGGISGLTAGYVLSRTDHVTLFEADRRLGGHADTHLVGAVPVDTGFIVYNEPTYPLLTRLFAELGVSTQASEMSMSVSCAGCGLHYAGKRGPAGLAAGLRQGGGRFLRLLADVPRFHRAGRRLLAGDPVHGPDDAIDTVPGADRAGRPADDLTFGEFLDQGGFSGYFQAHFALPLVAAVWSCPAGTALRYPARYLLAFLANHGMLSVSGAPAWRTVTGGSRCYVDRAAAALACVRLGVPIRAVRRYPDGAEVRDASGQAHQFDAVVIAAHPDQALTLLEPATRAEREVLGAFRYTPNPALLHTDTRLLPDRAAVRASWNYQLGHCQAGRTESTESVRISYHLNRLQHLPAGHDYVVTLNAQAAVDPDRIISRMDYAHPAYTPASVAAQRRLPELNTAVTAFAGAYHGWGFHEDGCRSGAQAARALGGIW
jgi:predicted NAD/FAD-binding protein